MCDAVSEATRALVLLMAPMMPHLAEECWKVLGAEDLVVATPWPTALQEFVVSDEVTIAVQVNGKRRAEIRLAKGLSSEDVEGRVLQLESVKRALEGKPVRKVIVVKDRIANIVSG